MGQKTDRLIPERRKIMTYTGKNGKSYTLGNEIKAGGEGTVYELSGSPDLVVKIYHDNKLDKDRTYLEEKIQTMIEQPVDPYINGELSIAWPVDILYDTLGLFVGYVMPKIKTNSSIIQGQRDTKVNFFKHYDYSYSVAMAYNMALIVSRVHASGSTIGDFNPTNILLHHNGSVCFVDTDSFNIRNKRTGKVYKCKVGVPEMLPPELQGRDLAGSNVEFNEATDSFGLAVHIFQLLMCNQHPFAVVIPQNLRSSSSAGGLESKITQGKCPYVTGSAWGSYIPASAPDIEMLPDYIRKLFDRTFTYTTATAVKASVINNRPSADEWVSALYKFHKSLKNRKESKVCGNDKSHIFLRQYGECPFCSKSNPGVNYPSLNMVNRLIPFINTPVNSPKTNNKKKGLSIKALSLICFALGFLLVLILTDLINDKDKQNNQQGSKQPKSGYETQESNNTQYEELSLQPTDFEERYSSEQGESYSADHYLSDEDVNQLDKATIQLMINEIYARHGYSFKDSGIRNYFLQYDWYSPSVSPENFDTGVFSSAEAANIRILSRYRDN